MVVYMYDMYTWDSSTWNRKLKVKWHIFASIYRAFTNSTWHEIFEHVCNWTVT